MSILGRPILGKPYPGDFPEFREMIARARFYVAGECHFSHVSAAAIECSYAARIFCAHPALITMADEWKYMVARCWNEWGFIPKEDEIDEEEFRVWLQEQLKVFEPFDPGEEILFNKD
ncbi:MAG: hypothetical protein AAGA60_09855 [Cyanobacteria bacterium P01_E01_bin.42]